MTTPKTDISDAFPPLSEEQMIRSIKLVKAPQIPWGMKTHKYTEAESEHAIVENIKAILETMGIKYEFNSYNFTFHLLHRCGSEDCKLHIYRNEGPNAKTGEAAYILEKDSYSRKYYHMDMYSQIFEAYETGIARPLVWDEEAAAEEDDEDDEYRRILLWVEESSA
jgi:hypothetical protein